MALSYSDKQALLEAMDIMIKGRFDNLKIPYWIEGKVIAISNDKQYTVLSRGSEIIVKARDGLSIFVGDLVSICVPNGDYSQKFIDSNKTSTTEPYTPEADIAAIKADIDILQMAVATADKHYTHEQSVSANTWICNHNLGKYPTVSIIDSAGTEIFGAIKHQDINTTILNFKAPFIGKAVFN